MSNPSCESVSCLLPHLMCDILLYITSKFTLRQERNILKKPWVSLRTTSDGSPRVHAELLEQGIRCSRKRVARRARHRTRTTQSDPSARVAPNLLQQDAIPLTRKLRGRAFRAIVPHSPQRVTFGSPQIGTASIQAGSSRQPHYG
jgi:hypothetical protein